MQKSTGYTEKLSVCQPDIVSKINEMNRIETEKKRKSEEQQEWEYHGETGEWQWIGEFEPVLIPDDPFPPLTEEEYKLAKEEDIKLMEEITKHRKKEQKEQRQKI